MNPIMENSGHPQASEAQRLAEAFRLFNQVSEELSGAYAGLQAQVERLTQELAEANGALRREYQEKVALTERLALLLDALPAGVVVLDPQGVVVQCNPAARSFFLSGLEGLAWEELAAHRLLPTEAPREFLLSASPGQEARRVALEVSELDSAGGRIVLLHDITAAHRQKAEAERKDRLAAMGEMAASLAHQLRTPLAAALLYTGNLNRPGVHEPLRIECANKAVSRLKHLEHLIQDVLLFVRGEVLGREPIIVAQLLAELAQTLEPVAREKGVAFSYRNEAEGASLMGDRKALTGALTNLLENALAAVPHEGGSIEFFVRRAVDGLEFHVRDNGQGVDAVTAERLFEPFFTTRSDGTGLGLAIARGVARAHGGGITLHRREQGGCEFVLSVACRDS